MQAHERGLAKHAPCTGRTGMTDRLRAISKVLPAGMAKGRTGSHGLSQTSQRLVTQRHQIPQRRFSTNQVLYLSTVRRSSDKDAAASRRDLVHGGPGSPYAFSNEWHQIMMLHGLSVVHRPK